MIFKKRVKTTQLLGAGHLKSAPECDKSSQKISDDLLMDSSQKCHPHQWVKTFR